MITDSTTDISCGPVSFNVRMARDHGWTEYQIRRTWSLIRQMAMDEGAVAEATFPDRTFTAPDGTKIFVGDLKPEQKKRLIDSYKKNNGC
jgi:hypothetical protein